MAEIEPLRMIECTLGKFERTTMLNAKTLPDEFEEKIFVGHRAFSVTYARVEEPRTEWPRYVAKEMKEVALDAKEHPIRERPAHRAGRKANSSSAGRKGRKVARQLPGFIDGTTRVKRYANNPRARGQPRRRGEVPCQDD